ncbi:ABC transporter permease subunit [Undibacter mobilis]|uniref:ABC transporter permease subunit n=1 Tax=Undibacter mobilis TaxID=2292256 RepID=A0A371BAD1_9BRAD|nr:ABC transporter permease subunit [Undibacter mobilis]
MMVITPSRSIRDDQVSVTAVSVNGGSAFTQLLFRVIRSPLLSALALLVAMLLALEWLVASGVVSPAVVARPSVAIAGIAKLQRDYDLFGAFRLTMTTTIVAILLELIVAIPFGYFLYRRRAYSIAYTGWLAALSAAPIFLLFPLFLVIFGRNVVTLIVMGFLPGVIPLILHVQDGFRSVKKTYLNVGESFGLSRSTIFWKIMVPAAAPTIFTGFRLALMYTLINIVAIEYLVDLGGLGRLVADRYFHFDIPATYGAIGAVTLVSVLLNWTIGVSEKLVRSR